MLLDKKKSIFSIKAAYNLSEIEDLEKDKRFPKKEKVDYKLKQLLMVPIMP